MNTASTPRIVRCPHCGKSSRFDNNNPDRPFCSSRCKTADVARWAEESYRIPAMERDPLEEMGRGNELKEAEDEDY